MIMSYTSSTTQATLLPLCTQLTNAKHICVSWQNGMKCNVVLIPSSLAVFRGFHPHKLVLIQKTFCDFSIYGVVHVTLLTFPHLSFDVFNHTHSCLMYFIHSIACHSLL